MYTDTVTMSTHWTSTLAWRPLMALIKAPMLTHPQLPGVTIHPLGSQRLQRGVPQSVLVVVQPFGIIPLHSHQVDANMHIIAGSAIILSEDEDNGAAVGPNHCWRFNAGGKHGFQAGERGLTFVSTNDGIVDKYPEKWDITF